MSAYLSINIYVFLYIYLYLTIYLYIDDTINIPGLTRTTAVCTRHGEGMYIYICVYVYII